MAVKKDITQQLETMKQFLMNNSHWTVLTYRDVADIIGTTPGSSTTKRVMDELKEDDNIIHTIFLDPSKGKKPLQFKYVTRQEKDDYLSRMRYDNLTDEEIESIRQAFDSETDETIVDVFVIVNHLKSVYGDKPFERPKPEHISSVLNIDVNDVDYTLDYLIVKDILIDIEGFVQLKLGQATSSATPERISIYHYFHQAHQAQKELTEYVEEQILPLVQSAHEMDEQLREGHEAMQKAIYAYEEERERNKFLHQKISHLEQQLESALNFKNDLSNLMQDQLQIFLWQVQQIALEDSKTSISTKNTNSYRATLAKKYTDVGQQFYDQVLGLSKI